MTIQTSASPRPAAPAASISLQPERPEDAARVEALVDRAFGPGRFTKVSERVREFAQFAPAQSMCAWSGGVLMGVARMWRVSVGDQPVMFLGPLAVEAEQRSAGLGAQLVAQAAEAAAAAGEAWVLLVGDEAFFSRIGFSGEATRAVTMPGPVDPARVLARRLSETAAPLVGRVGPRGMG
jgi:predicted N-acetyltransferase YhbS